MADNISEKTPTKIARNFWDETAYKNSEKLKKNIQMRPTKKMASFENDHQKQQGQTQLVQKQLQEKGLKEQQERKQLEN